MKGNWSPNTDTGDRPFLNFFGIFCTSVLMFCSLKVRKSKGAQMYTARNTQGKTTLYTQRDGQERGHSRVKIIKDNETRRWRRMKQRHYKWVYPYKTYMNMKVKNNKLRNKEKGAVPTPAQGQAAGWSGGVYLRVLFTREGRGEQVIDRQIGATAAVMQML